MLLLKQFILLLILIQFQKVLLDRPFNKLYRDIFRDYEPFLRPVKNASKPVNVTLSYLLTAVEDVAEAEQLIKTRGWLKMKWKDELLFWNASEYFGINSIILPVSKIWKPTVTLMNDVNRFDILSSTGGDLRVSNTGDVTMFLGLVVGTQCDINIINFPFDSQTCSLQFIPWTSSVDEVDLFPHKYAWVESKVKGEWKIGEVSYKRSLFKVENLTQAVVEVHVVLHRNPLSFIISGIIPMLLLSVVNLGSFLLPVGSEERISLGVSVLLSFYVFVSTINSLLPDVSDTLSIFRVYVLTMLTVKVMTTMSSVFIIRFYNNPDSESLPRWMKKLLSLFQRDHPDAHEEQPVEVSNKSRIVRNEKIYSWKMAAKALNAICFVTVFTITFFVSIVCFCVSMKMKPNERDFQAGFKDVGTLNASDA